MKWDQIVAANYSFVLRLQRLSPIDWFVEREFQTCFVFNSKYDDNNDSF